MFERLMRSITGRRRHHGLAHRAGRLLGRRRSHGVRGALRRLFS